MVSWMSLGFGFMAKSGDCPPPAHNLPPACSFPRADLLQLVRGRLAISALRPTLLDIHFLTSSERVMLLFKGLCVFFLQKIYSILLFLICILLCHHYSLHAGILLKEVLQMLRYFAHQKITNKPFPGKSSKCKSRDQGIDAYVQNATRK